MSHNPPQGATEYEEGTQELQQLLHWLRALQQLPAPFPASTLPRVQSLAHQPGSGQDGDVKAARDAGDKPRCCQPSLAPGLYSRAGSGLCSAPKEGKQQLCFLWRARTEQKSLSSALRENVSRARLGGEVPRSPLSCRFHSHYAHLGNLSPGLAKKQKTPRCSHKASA